MAQYPAGRATTEPPAGSHHIVALRPAYKLDANVALAAGQRQAVAADWKPKAVLALNWPPSQRAGAELKIDGRTHAVTQHDPLEIAVEPGPHVVQITRPDSAPMVRSVTVAPEGRALVAIAPQPRTSKLVFDWPADQRKDAELVIDGHSQTIAAGSAGAPAELKLDPGRHVIRISRTGFEAFKQTIDLAAGAGETVKPTWTPVQTVASDTADTQAPVETPTDQPARKLSIPPAAEQEKVAKQLADLYKSTHSGSKDPAKAQELYDLAAKPGISPAERYVLLAKGAELAAAAGDVNLSLQGVDSLDTEFEIDALEAKQKLLDKFVTAGKPEQVESAIPIAEQFMDQAVAADRFALAIEFSMTASHAATKSKIATRKEIDDRLSRRRHDIHVLEPFFAAAKTAQETLAKNPADAEANSDLGRWLCFYKADWSAGLPLLAKGSDEKLKSLAEQEAKAPTDAEQQAHLADGWWDLASKESGIARGSIHLHAGEIYNEALLNLNSALRKAAIEKRLTEIADVKPLPAPIAPSSPTGPPTFPLNRWVDLLCFVDTTKDVVAGKWSRSGTVISVEPSGGARVAIPVAIDGSYDLEVKFTRDENSDEIETSIPVGSRGVSLMLGGGDGAVSGFDTVDGRRPFDGGNPTTVHSRDIVNGQECLLLAKVRLHGDDQASVDIFLNGKQLLPHWQGSPSTLAINGYWSMPRLDRPGLGAWNTRATFRSARLRMVSGQASADGAVVVSPLPHAAPALAVSEKPTGAVKFPLGRWVNVLPLINPTENIIRGAWLRKGADLYSEGLDVSEMELPLTIEGGYDIEVDFTRTQGDNDVQFIFPVGSHQCHAVLSADHGNMSGLYELDKHELGDSAILTRSGSLENGRRYRVGISVRIRDERNATIAVSLDGKPYLPDWKGDPESCSASAHWATSGLQRMAVGQRGGSVVFHSARLRMVSGHATADPPFVPESGAPAILSARWGAGGKWEDVTLRVQKLVRHGETVRASTDFFDSDPIGGTRKQLEITYEKGGKQGAVSINEGEQWSKDDYEKLAP